MAELTTGSTSTQKVKLLSANRVGKGSQIDKIELSYKRTDNKADGKEMKTSKFTSDFTDDEKSLLKEVSNGKDNSELVIIKELFQKDGKNYWNLKTVKPVSTYTPPTYNNSKSYSKGGYNEAGIKVGAVLHDATTIATSQKGSKVTVSDVETAARELLTLSVTLEKEVKNGMFSSSNNTNATPATTTTEEDSFASLDDISSDDDFDIDL